MSQDRKALDASACAVMILLTALWGLQQVTVKLNARIAPWKPGP
ncbi:MAG: hypothetical protein ACT4P3_22015 [Betaproteobacteria bacterium]